MKKLLMVLITLLICAGFLATQYNRNPARAAVLTPVATVSDTEFGVNDILPAYLLDNEIDLVSSVQQVGMKCYIHPHCPDCDGKGDVCFGAEEFFPGATVLAKGKSYMVTKCRQANALDYCGGSRSCVKKSRQEQEQFRKNYGGGCFAQCLEKNVVCILQSR